MADDAPRIIPGGIVASMINARGTKEKVVVVKADLKSSVFITLRPTFEANGNVSGFSVVNMTKKYPENPFGLVVKINLMIPISAFQALECDVKLQSPIDDLIRIRNDLAREDLDV